MENKISFELKIIGKITDKLIENLSKESIKKAIEDMLKSKEFESAFLQIK